MKKLIIILFVIVSMFTFSSLTSAAPATMTKEVISDIYYQSGYYVAHTKADKDGRFWVLDVVSLGSKKENKELTKQLKQMYIGKVVHIVYNEALVDDIEIIDTWIE